jgi:hypothetical protein
MTTAPTTLINLQFKLVNNLNTVNLGIVGDAAHVATGGYHIGAVTLRANGMSNDYSLQYPLDNNAQHDFACAIDIGGSPDQLMVLGNRIVHALMNQDPRVYNKVRAVNAPFDGQNQDRRYDTESPNNPSDDNVQSSSDQNHIHIEIYRTLVTDQNVIDGVYDVFAGNNIQVVPTQGDVEMANKELIVDGGNQQIYVVAADLSSKTPLYGTDEVEALQATGLYVDAKLSSTTLARIPQIG